jgi:hypothetical protein
MKVRWSYQRVVGIKAPRPEEQKSNEYKKRVKLKERWQVQIMSAVELKR